MAERAAPAVRDNEAAGRFEIGEGEETSVLYYERRPGAIVLIHTEVPPALRGRGLAQALARHALERARAEGWRVIPVCPFVQSYLKKHPQ